MDFLFLHLRISRKQALGRSSRSLMRTDPPTQSVREINMVYGRSSVDSAVPQGVRGPRGADFDDIPSDRRAPVEVALCDHRGQRPRPWWSSPPKPIHAGGSHRSKNSSQREEPPASWSPKPSFSARVIPFKHAAVAQWLERWWSNASHQRSRVRFPAASFFPSAQLERAR